MLGAPGFPRAAAWGGSEAAAIRDGMHNRDDPMRVAAVIVTFDRAALLARALRALAAQTRPPEGVVVVDNAGSNDTLKVLARDFPLVDVVKMDENVGVNAGLAVGMQRAREGVEQATRRLRPAEVLRGLPVRAGSRDPREMQRCVGRTRAINASTATSSSRSPACHTASAAPSGGALRPEPRAWISKPRAASRGMQWRPMNPPVPVSRILMARSRGTSDRARRSRGDARANRSRRPERTGGWDVQMSTSSKTRATRKVLKATVSATAAAA